ncbi:hypothetical protein ACJ72_01074 [Emergomyces africanus]|uniref:Uncharacterized protein n=1 Tax=Emergomyces africanus TaxID=1955775 RepID=A0A1B7P697_9EURO|nr:hypothetical protein ACJ72_01074 [Emergomyces africanus]
MSSYPSNEPLHRRVWLDSEAFKDDLDACIINRGVQNRQRNRSNALYAIEYYKQPVKKGSSSVVLLFLLPTVLHFIGTCTSDIFLKCVQQPDSATSIFIAFNMIFTYISLGYQWEDRRRPCLRVQIIHNVSSLLVAGTNVAFAAYVGIDREKSGLRGLISAVTMALVSFLTSVGSSQLLIKGVIVSLGKTKWTSRLSLLWHSTPPEDVAWQSLPDAERAWAQSKREEYLARSFPEQTSHSNTPLLLPAILLLPLPVIFLLLPQLQHLLQLLPLVLLSFCRVLFLLTMALPQEMVTVLLPGVPAVYGRKQSSTGAPTMVLRNYDLHKNCTVHDKQHQGSAMLSKFAMLLFDNLDDHPYT